MPKVCNWRGELAGHFIYRFDMRERDFVRSTGTQYPDGPPPHGMMRERDDVLVADTGHAFWPEAVRRGVSENNGVVPDEVQLTFESVELFTNYPQLGLGVDDLYLELYVGDQPQARYSVMHLLRAKVPLPVRRGTRAVTVPPRQCYYWQLSRRGPSGGGHAVFHVAVAYTTEDYEAVRAREEAAAAPRKGQLGQ